MRIRLYSGRQARPDTFIAYAYVYAYISDTTIRLSTQAKARLDLHKRADESYEDVIMRLTGGDRWAGFGALAEEDGETREGMRRVREEMRDGMAEDGGDEPGNGRGSDARSR